MRRQDTLVLHGAPQPYPNSISVTSLVVHPVNPMGSSRPPTSSEVEDYSDSQTPPAESFYSPNERLSTSFTGRLFLCNIGTFAVGTVIGGALGSRQASLRFRAENAHRFPTSERGWFFYHKSKNYYTALGGVKEGVKTGAKLCSWVTMFVVTEEAVDRLRGRSDFLSTVVAGLSLSGFFSVWSLWPKSCDWGGRRC